MGEKFFILTPTPTNQTAKDSMGNEFPVYLNAQGDPLKWSGNFPVPVIGSRVFVTMNSIGWAVVKGYFQSARLPWTDDLANQSTEVVESSTKARIEKRKAHVEMAS